MQFKEIPICENGCQTILFCSYEERSLRVAKELAEQNYEGNIYLYYCDDMRSRELSENIKSIRKIFANKIHELPISYKNPFSIIASVKNIDFSYSTLIDISCFNRGNLFPFLWALEMGKKKYPEVTFAYSAPEKYGDWLSRDYDAPANIIGFPGMKNPAESRLLICAVGYESDRAMAVISAAEPSKVILTVGDIPTKGEFLKRNINVVNEVYGSSNYEIIKIDVSDPNKSKNDLYEIIKEVDPTTSIQFAPFSSKLSCLGIWALWLDNPEIRIWNAQPKIYNVLDYSKGSTDPRYFLIKW